jgi:hypothetical protein
MIYRNLRPGYEYTVNTNYANHPRIAAVAWTASGYKSYMRSLLSFQLSAIPSGSTIQSATLYFYSDPNISGSSDANGNSQLSGSNAFYLEKVTSAWNEFTVTWNTQPSTTTADRVWVGPSVSTTENRQINITNIVQGWVNNPQSNFGLKMFLENEVHYRSRNYASKNHTNTALHPKLVINYNRKGNPVVLKEDIDFFSPLGFINDGSFLYGEASEIKLDVFISEMNEEATNMAQESRLISSRFPGWNTDAAWSPDGRYLAYNSRRDHGKHVVVLHDANTGEENDKKKMISRPILAPSCSGFRIIADFSQSWKEKTMLNHFTS